MGTLTLKRKPSFWDPAKVDQWYAPDFEAVLREGRVDAAKIKAATKQPEQNMLVIIDAQWDFSDKGRLPVTGTFADIERLCRRIIEGVYSGFYTKFMITYDCHPPIVIHGSSWWRDEQGNPPDVSLPVQMKLADPADYRFEGIFLDGRPNKSFWPLFDRKGTVEYAQHLEATKQNDGKIWVWVAHCKVGTDGISLIPALAEVIYWAAATLRIEPISVWKGMLASTDWFGPFRPCKEQPKHPQGGIQTVYLDEIRSCTHVDIAGEAKDFCVLAGTEQVMEYYGSQLDVLSRIRFLNDCTSAIVPGSPAVQQFEANMKAKGIQLITHDQF